LFLETSIVLGFDTEIAITPVEKIPLFVQFNVFTALLFTWHPPRAVPLTRIPLMHEAPATPASVPAQVKVLTELLLMVTGEVPEYTIPLFV